MRIHTASMWKNSQKVRNSESVGKPRQQNLTFDIPNSYIMLSMTQKVKQERGGGKRDDFFFLVIRFLKYLYGSSRKDSVSKISFMRMKTMYLEILKV